MRHRLEYCGRVGQLRALLRVLPHAVVRTLGAAVSGCCSTRLDRPHRRVAIDNLAQCFPSRTEAERRAIARKVFCTFRPAAVRDFSSSARCRTPACLQRVEFEGEDRARLRVRAGQGRAVFHRSLRLLGAARARARAAAAANRRARPRARQSTDLNRCSKTCDRAPATPSFTSRRGAARAQDAGGRRGRRAAHRSAHAQPGCDLGRLLRTARRRRRRRWRRSRCAPARPWSRCSRSRCRADATG